MCIKKALSIALPLLAALPMHVLAAPVTITTTLQGVLEAKSYSWGILEELYMPMALYYADQPYALTIESTFDPDKVESYGDDRRYFKNTDMKVTFKLGDYTYRGSNAGTTELEVGAGSYSQCVGYINWSLQFCSSFKGPQGDLGDDLFAPRQLSASGDSVGYVGIGYFRGMGGGGTPELSEYLSDMNPTRATLSITSAVPEPAHWAMLAAGLLTIAATARRGARKRNAG